ASWSGPALSSSELTQNTPPAATANARKLNVRNALMKRSVGPNLFTSRRVREPFGLDGARVGSRASDGLRGMTPGGRVRPPLPVRSFTISSTPLHRPSCGDERLNPGRQTQNHR